MVLWAKRTVRVSSRDTTGDQDITIAGIGTPAAVRIDMTIARVNNTLANSAWWSKGLYDGTRVRAIGQNSIDNEATTICYDCASNDQIAFLINGTGTGASFAASVVGWITDGVRINVGTASGLSHYLHVTFYYGTAVSAYVGTHQMPDSTGSPDQNDTVSAPGFQPDVLFGFMGPATFAAGVSPTTSITISEGVGVRSPTLEQVAIATTHATGQATARPTLCTHETRIAHIVGSSLSGTPLTVLFSLELVSFSGTGFTLKDKVGSNPPAFMYLALRYGGRDVHLDKITSPTSVNGTVVIDNNQRVDSAHLLTTTVTSTGDKANTEAGCFGVGQLDRSAAEAWSQFDQDDVDPTNAGTISRTGYAIKQLETAGTTGLEATVTFGDDNMTLTFPTVLSTGRLQWVATFEQAITGTAAILFRSLVVASTAREVFQATSAIVFRSLQVASAGILSEEGVGTVTFRSLQVAGTAREVIQGTSAITFRSLQVASTGLEVEQGTGAISFPALQVAAEAVTIEVVFGPGAVVFRSLQVAGTASSGLLTIAGTGAVLFRSLQVASTGLEVERGTGTVVFPALQISGAGQEKLQGTGAVVFRSLVVAGAGQEVFQGASTILFGALQVAAAGQEAQVGSGAITFPALQVASQGTENITGVGTLVFPSFRVAGLGGGITLGVVVFPAFQVASLGAENFIGSGAIVFPALQVASQAIEAVTGTGALLFPALQINAQALEAIVGTSNLVFPALQIAGSGALTFGSVTGVGSIVFPALSVSSAALVISTITGEGALVFPSLIVAGTGIAGVEILTNKKRIRDALMTVARNGEFLRMRPAQDDTILEGDFVVPQSIGTNEIRSNFQIAERWRRSYKLQRGAWVWELILMFDKEVTAELFERAYLDAPIILPHDRANDLASVIIRLVGSSYTHPPTQQSSNGTKITYQFNAQLHPV